MNDRGDKMPTKQVCECYSCEREVPVEQGAMRDLPYDEYIGQVFLCNECIAHDEAIIERFESGEQDDLS
jgi:hypothetical protein